MLLSSNNYEKKIENVFEKQMFFFVKFIEHVFENVFRVSLPKFAKNYASTERPRMHEGKQRTKTMKLL